MADLWEKVKKTATEIYTSASEKAVEGVNLGVKKLDEVTLRRELSREFAGLGGRTYQLLEKQAAENIADDPTIRKHLDRLKELESRLEEKEREIQSIRHPHAPGDDAGDAGPAAELASASPQETAADAPVDATHPRD